MHAPCWLSRGRWHRRHQTDGSAGKAEPRNPNFREMLGQMYYETGQPTKALSPLKRAVELAPKEPEFRMIYALALADTGAQANVQEAIRQLKRVSATSPRSARPFSILARAYAKLATKDKPILPPPRRPAER